jgi:hypothetical protein
MSGGVETGHGREMGHRQTKEPATVNPCLNHRATTRLYCLSAAEQS